MNDDKPDTTVIGLQVSQQNQRHLDDLVSFKTCSWPVASVSQSELGAVLEAARSHGPGAAVIESCQRVEAFHDLQSCDCGALSSWTGFDALLRVAEVAAGLHSIALGEEQILGQVRASFAVAGSRLAELGGIAVGAARSLRSEEEFNVHTGHLLDLALHLTGVPAEGRIAVVGAGAVGGLVVRRAVELGFSGVTVVARREPDNAWFDASSMHYVPFGGPVDIDPIDVLVTCLGSAVAPLAAHELPEVRRLAVDLGTPRNIGCVLDAPLLTIADMLAAPASHSHSDARRTALRARLRELLLKRLEMAATDSHSHLGRLRLEVELIRRDEAARIARLHPELSPRAVEAITRSLVNQIFHRPTERLRTLDDPSLGAHLVNLFAACPRPEADS